MLADSTEAVVRSSRDRSHERIGELVDGVIAERVTEGQFDECDLTMRDLRIIGESFKATLRGIYHPRIEYPSPTAAEIQSSSGRTAVAYLKPPSDPMEAPPGLTRRATCLAPRRFRRPDHLDAVPFSAPLIMALPKHPLS